MKHTPHNRRLPIGRVLFLSLIAFSVLIPLASGQTAQKATLFLRPQCNPKPNTPCPTFEVENPDMLRTPLLLSGAILDMELVLSNPNKLPISRVRAWLLYNPSLLQGLTLDFGKILPNSAPNEKNFSVQDGFMKIDASAPKDKEGTDAEFLVAHIRLKLKGIPTNVSKEVISFFDVKNQGHTMILAKNPAGGEPLSILDQNPGSLLLRFAEYKAAASSSSTSPSSVASSIASTSSSSAPSSSASSSASSIIIAICGNGIVESPEECDDGNFLNGDTCNIYCRTESTASSSSSSSQSSGTPPPLLPDGTVCANNNDCRSGLCSRGICRGDLLKVEDGGACTASNQCLGHNCENDICVTKVGAASSAAGSEGRTAFGMLQVRDLRITTEGSSVFLAWEPLVSSQLKAYNVYYGTTSGRYIQRKSISSDSTSITLRSLPEKTKYYFAIRALNNQDEESAFSQEVGIEVGSPTTSTSPLTGRIISEKNLDVVQGETGMPFAFLLLSIASAVIGTMFAFRRQLIALPSPPPKS